MDFNCKTKAYCGKLFNGGFMVRSMQRRTLKQLIEAIQYGNGNEGQCQDE